MDIQPQTTKPISDDQELAKVLAGITQSPAGNWADNNPTSVTITPSYNQPEITPAAPDTAPTSPAPAVTQNTQSPNMTTSEMPINNLDDIKKQALLELRPLVEKLTLEPDEKFNIYLLLLRSTDDKTLIPLAYSAAKDIPDETKRAQALLDTIKEIDYLSHPNPTV
jgi:hypothetical protein